jgi:hypothetical protein
VVLKGTFDDLMKEIGSKKLMDVSAGETMCKRLKIMIFSTQNNPEASDARTIIPSTIP